MKYWAYLNDDVSQKPYTEEELQQIPGFGPDILICSEVSAVSRDPEWKPVKEVLPHLIRPKAPDFSKFRPKPPVPNQQDGNNVLPVPQNLPSGVNASPVEQQASNQNVANSGLDANLIAQLQNLTAKISSLEDKIVEQEKELSEKNNQTIADINAEETFVSEPQNEQEDDVLEVPFDSDFEVPFDVNKSSEEIASEAEAMLAKHDSTEIEEYDADDSNTELMDYNSDMQKILEDTIRETDYHSEPVKPQKKKKEKRTIIAEDLISKKTLNLSEKPEKSSEESAEQKTEEKSKKENTTEKAEQNIVKEEEKPSQFVEESSEEKQEEPAEEKEEILEEKLEEPVEENKELTENNSEELIEEKEQEIEKPAEENTDNEQQAEPQLVSVDEAPEGQEEKAPETEEEQAEPQLVSVDEAPEGQTKDSPEIKEEQLEPQLVSVDEASKEDEEITEQKENQELQVVPEEENLEESAEEKQEEPSQEENAEEPLEENLEEKEEEPAKEEQAESLEEKLEDNTSETKEELEQEKDQELQVAPEEEVEEIKEEPEQEYDDGSQEDNRVVDSVAEKVEVPSDIEDNDNLVQTARVSTMTQGVTISDDDTTAAVLNEIAEEKGQDVNPVTTSDKLFVELENTYKDEGSKDKENEVVSGNTEDSKEGSDAEIDLNEDLAKEDEFLKTFTTSVEEVFLDQPTAIISDYVPPTTETDNINHALDVPENNIKREKPSDIKTVPLVPGNVGEEIWSSPYVESGTAKLGKKSVLSNLVKWIVVILSIAIIVAGALSALAVMGIIPESFSPIHTVIYSLQKTPQVDNTVSEESAELAPEMIDQNTNVEQDNSVTEQNQVYDIISKIKNYTFSDGTTLEERINSAHNNVANEIEWTLFPTEEQNIYSVAAKIPQNKDGQGFSYRFNYNITEGELTPTTSEAKNIIENYSK